MIYKHIHKWKLIYTTCFFLVACFPLMVIAQKKVDQVIPDAEKRKIIKAKKLFNSFKIYEGEKIVKDLVREHPHEAYYHEALVQLQRQVLDQLRPALNEYQSFKTALPSDSLSKEDDEDSELYQHDSKNDNQPIAKKDTVEIEWNGLDTGPRKEDKIKRKKIDDDEAEPVLQDATVTIDSSLLKDDFIEDENGVPIKKAPKKDRTLEKQLKAISELAQIPYDGYKNDLIQNCRKATLQVEFADSASFYLRQLTIDTLDPDIRASDAAVEYFENGMIELNAKEAMLAIRFFKQAIEIHADYYNAHLFIGDAYSLAGKDKDAIKEYHKANLLQPNKVEPFEKLSLFYYQIGKYKEAAVACIDAIQIYPHQHFMQLLKRIVNKTGKDFNTQWLLREVYPLTTAKNYFEITALEKTPWWQYQAAESDVHSYFDTLGIVRPNEKTNERYLEIYAWQRMLADTKKDAFPFARAMQKIGFLDCYVLITCFHHDLYGQFKDFVKTNPEKIKEYFYILINWEDKKFEKLRNEFFPKKIDTTDKLKTENKK